MPFAIRPNCGCGFRLIERFKLTSRGLVIESAGLRLDARVRGRTMSIANQQIELRMIDCPKWAMMWLLAVAIFAGCKLLTWSRRTVRNSPWWLEVGYLIAWPGLDADAFLQSSKRQEVARPALGEWAFAFGKLAIGCGVLVGVVRLIPKNYPYFIGWVGMSGIVLILHFGLFHLLSCAWRSIGVDARPLMNWPLRSTSLSEFWGQRWNTAFRDLTHRFLFRPLLPRLGARGALLVGFVFSGIVHDVVISGPTGGGYGGPTLYFLIQAVGLLSERSRLGKSVGLGSGWRGWLFTMSLLAAPAGLLFHPPFVLRVVNPFLQALGATG
jgi:hypothetical protein